MRRRFFSVAFALVCVAATSADVSANNDIPVGGGAAPLQADLVYRGWGAWELSEPTGEPVAVPGTTRALAVSSGVLVSVDYRSGDIIIGDPVALVGTRITVDPTGRWAYVSTLSSTNDVNVSRYRVDDLSRDDSFSIGFLGNTSTAPSVSVAAVPGDEALLLVVVNNSVRLFRDGLQLSDFVSDDRLRYSLVVAADDSVAYAAGPSGLFRLDLADAGVTGIVEISSQQFPESFSTLASMRVIDDVVVVATQALPVGETTLRLATEFELATPDPLLPLRYFIGSGSITIYAADTGEIITGSRSQCLVDDGTLGVGRISGTIVGGGLITDGRLVADVLDRCGSYGEFTPVVPGRVFDSRFGVGNGGVPQRLVGGDTTRIKIHGRAGVPETGVESVVLNVTPVDQRGAPFGSYVTVWPAGFPPPEVASLTVTNGEIVGNMVTVSTAAGGYVDVFTLAGTTDLVIDVMGYFSSALAPRGDRYSSVPIYRALDTRDSRPLGPGERVTLRPDSRLTTNSGPDWDIDDVTALVLNVTAVGPTAGSHLRIFPSGPTLPEASSMNFPADAATNRLVTTMVGTGGAVDIWNAAGTTDVVVDIVGVYADGSRTSQAGRFVGAEPFRLFDSRNSSPFPGDGKIAADNALLYSGGFPEEDLVVNLTVNDPEAAGFLSAGTLEVNPDIVPDLTKTSSLNHATGQTIGNQSIISTGFNGDFGVYSLARAHVIIDYFGYYTSRGSVQL